MELKGMAVVYGCALAPSACAKAAQGAALGGAFGYLTAKLEGKSDAEARQAAVNGAESGAVTGGLGKVLGPATTVEQRAVKGTELAGAAAATTKAQGGSNGDAAAAAVGTFAGEMLTGKDAGATLGGVLLKKAVSTGTKEATKAGCSTLNNGNKC